MAKRSQPPKHTSTSLDTKDYRRLARRPEWDGLLKSLGAHITVSQADGRTELTFPPAAESYINFVIFTHAPDVVLKTVQGSPLRAPALLTVGDLRDSIEGLPPHMPVVVSGGKDHTYLNRGNVEILLASLPVSGEEVYGEWSDGLAADPAVSPVGVVVLS